MSSEEGNAAADEIAKKLIETLVEGFRAKEKRDPTPEEVGELMAELSEERIAALLSGEDADEPEKEGEVEENREGEDKPVEETDKENIEQMEKKEKDGNIVKEKKDKAEDEKITGKKREVEEDKKEETSAFKWPKAAAA
jgi:tRNA G18 (ribose-2'-O)-methylase SpoU